MIETTRPPTPLQRALLWAVWWVTLAFWSWWLLSARAPGAVAMVVADEMRFWVAKTAHVCGFALLSILAGCLPVRPGARVGWQLFLVCYAGLTEYLQLFIPGRHGSLRDVGLDLVGLTLGLSLLWTWRRLRPG